MNASTHAPHKRQPAASSSSGIRNWRANARRNNSSPMCRPTNGAKRPRPRPRPTGGEPEGRMGGVLGEQAFQTDRLTYIPTCLRYHGLTYLHVAHTVDVWCADHACPLRKKECDLRGARRSSLMPATTCAKATSKMRTTVRGARQRRERRGHEIRHWQAWARPRQAVRRRSGPGASGAMEKRCEAGADVVRNREGRT